MAGDPDLIHTPSNLTPRLKAWNQYDFGNIFKRKKGDFDQIDWYLE